MPANVPNTDSRVPFKVAVTVPEPVIVAAVDVSTGTGVSRARKLAAGACAADAPEASTARLAVAVPSIRTIDDIAVILRWLRGLVKGEEVKGRGATSREGIPEKWPREGYLP
jgi:hypothetical protein